MHAQSKHNGRQRACARRRASEGDPRRSHAASDNRLVGLLAGCACPSSGVPRRCSPCDWRRTSPTPSTSRASRRFASWSTSAATASARCVHTTAAAVRCTGKSCAAASAPTAGWRPTAPRCRCGTGGAAPASAATPNYSAPRASTSTTAPAGVREKTMTSHRQGSHHAEDEATPFARPTDAGTRPSTSDNRHCIQKMFIYTVHKTEGTGTSPRISRVPSFRGLLLLLLLFFFPTSTDFAFSRCRTKNIGVIRGSR